MTRYDELAEQAVRFAMDLHNDKARCLQCALQLQAQLQRYLESPHQAIWFVTYDSDFQAIDDQRADLLLAPDRRWYFGIGFHFQVPPSNAYQRVTVKFGVQSEGRGFLLYYDETFRVSLEDRSTFQPVVEFVCRGLAEDFAKPIYSPRTRIGF